MGCPVAHEVVAVLGTRPYYNVNLTVCFYAVAFAASVNTSCDLVPNWVTSRHFIFLFCFNNPILSHIKQLVNKKDKKNYLPVQPLPVGINRTIVRAFGKKNAGQIAQQSSPSRNYLPIIKTIKFVWIKQPANTIETQDIGVPQPDPF